MEDNVNESIKEKFVKGSKGKEILIQNEKYKFFCRILESKFQKSKFQKSKFQNLNSKI